MTWGDFPRVGREEDDNLVSHDNHVPSRLYGEGLAVVVHTDGMKKKIFQKSY